MKPNIESWLVNYVNERYEKRREVIEGILRIKASEKNRRSVCLALIENFFNWLENEESIYDGILFEEKVKEIRGKLFELGSQILCDKYLSVEFGDYDAGLYNSLLSFLKTETRCFKEGPINEEDFKNLFEKRKENERKKGILKGVEKAAARGNVDEEDIRKLPDEIADLEDVDEEDIRKLPDEMIDLEKSLKLVKEMNDCEKSDILEKKFNDGEYPVNRKWKIKYKKANDYKLNLYGDLIQGFSERFDKICSLISKNGKISSEYANIINQVKCRLGALYLDYGLLRGNEQITNNLRKYNVVNSDEELRIGEDMTFQGNICRLGINSKTCRGHVWYDYDFFVSSDHFKEDVAEKSKISLYSNGDLYSLLGNIELYVKQCGGKISKSISNYYDRLKIGEFMIWEDIVERDVWKIFKEITAFSNGSYWIRNGDNLAILECSDEGFWIRDYGDYDGDDCSAKLLLRAKRAI